MVIADLYKLLRGSWTGSNLNHTTKPTNLTVLWINWPGWNIANVSTTDASMLLFELLTRVYQQTITNFFLENVTNDAIVIFYYDIADANSIYKTLLKMSLRFCRIVLLIINKMKIDLLSNLQRWNNNCVYQLVLELLLYVQFDNSIYVRGV